MREKELFIEDQLHHPFVAVIQHVTSPLTSALCIFGVYKTSHLPKIRAWLRAVWIIRNTPATVKPHHVPQKVSPFGHAHHRSFTSSSSTASPSARSPFWSTRPGPMGLGSFPPIGLRARMHMTPGGPLQQRRNFSGLVTEGPRLVGDGSELMSESSRLVSESSRLVSESSGLVSESARLVAESSGLVTEGLKSASTFFPSSWYVTSPYTGGEIVWTSELMQNLLNYAHVDLGLPWWQCIMGVTLMLRFAVLPLNVSLVRNTLRLHQIKPEITHLQQRMRSSIPEERLDAANSLVTLFMEKKCHPLKNVISPFLFPPMFLSLFGAVYDISTHTDTGGMLWFPDLSASDPTFVLPVLSALTWLATIEMAAGEHFPLKPWILSATRLAAIAFIPVTMTLPSGVFIFWLTSNLFACTRAFVVRQPSVAKALGIPVFPKVHAPKTPPALQPPRA